MRVPEERAAARRARGWGRRLVAAAVAVALVGGCAGVAVSGVAASGVVASGVAGPADAVLPFGSAQAWADTTVNKAIPTDDTGVVESANEKDKAAENAGAGSGGSGSADKAAGGAGGDQANSAAQPSSTSPAGQAPAEGSPGADQATEGTGAEDAANAANAADAEGASGPEGEQPADATAQKPVVPMPRKPVLPDPVFGEGVNEDNLVNPQQKPDSSFIYDTPINALQQADSYLNGQTVQVTGEVVGDLIRAEHDEGFCWIVLQANDGSYAEVPVLISADAAEAIDTYGAYGRKGTTLQIRGTFHLSCSDHEGLSDLHADAVSVVEKGSITEQVFDAQAFVPGLALVLVGVVMMLVFRHLREGRR